MTKIPNRPVFKLQKSRAWGSVSTLPWFDAFVSASGQVQSGGALNLLSTEAELLGMAQIRALPAIEQDLAALGFWAGLLEEDPTARLAKQPDAVSVRICRLIDKVAKAHPDLVSDPYVWNSPGVRTAGTLFERLLRQDVPLDMDLLSDQSRSLLLYSGRGLIQSGEVVFFSMASVTHGQRLYRSAQWACHDASFAADFAAGLNNGFNQDPFLKACVRSGPSGNSARQILGVIAREHRNQLAAKFSSQLKSSKLSGTVANLLDHWLRAIRTGEATQDIVPVVMDICMLTGRDYGETIRLIARRAASGHFGTAGQVNSPDKSMLALFAGFAQAGITPELPVRYNGASVAFRDLLGDHFSPELVAAFEMSSQESTSEAGKSMVFYPERMRA